jgi:hypothetical protein
MDNPYASGGIGAGAVVALGVLYRVYLAVNHHRVRSNCCGKEIVASIDIEKTTPPPDIKIRIPPIESSVEGHGKMDS